LEHFVATIALIGIVIVAASLASGALERSGLPLVAAFLALGVIVGPHGLGLLDMGIDSPALQVLAILGLALVLFSDAVSVDVRQLRSESGISWRVLGPGTILPAVITGLAAHWLLDLSWIASSMIGAALASTDPVLIRSILRSGSLPKTAQVALRLETGMNDVVLLPIVMIAILLAKSGSASISASQMGDVGKHLLGIFLLGPLLGAAIGWVGIIVLDRIRGTIGVRRDYESMYALGLAFTGFATAEAVGGSGFLAAFAAGLMIAAQDVELCDCFLEYGEATAEMFLLLTFVALGTSAMWLGFDAIDGPTLLLAAIALTARTVVLYPVLAGLGLSKRDRWLVSLLGPRGLSSLLLILLPVFAGIPGTERLFSITALVVMLSIVLHGGGMGMLQRKVKKPRKPVQLPQLVEEPVDAFDAEAEPTRITVAEMKAMRDRGENVVIVDARAPRSYQHDPRQAVGAVRLNPDDPVRDATAQRLSQRATLVVYCA
jgi:NhaP-type Na+/H+ or K+/H+ antiporter